MRRSKLAAWATAICMLLLWLAIAYLLTDFLLHILVDRAGDSYMRNLNDPQTATGDAP